MRVCGHDCTCVRDGKSSFSRETWAQMGTLDGNTWPPDNLSLRENAQTIAFLACENFRDFQEEK